MVTVLPSSRLRGYRQKGGEQNNRNKPSVVHIGRLETIHPDYLKECESQWTYVLDTRLREVSQIPGRPNAQ